MKAVPDALRREGISNNVEANGQNAKLHEWEDKAADEHKPGYEAGQNLTDKEMTLRDHVRSTLEAWKNLLQHHNLLPADAGLENYIPHRPDFEDIDPVTHEPINPTGADGETDFLKKRLYPSHAEGEQAGIKYKTKDAVKLTSNYMERANNAIARNTLGEDLANGNLNDAAPMAVSGGYLGHPADVPLSPLEVQQLQASGKFDDLLKKGRIYEVKGKTPLPTGPEPLPKTGGANGNGASPSGYKPTEKATTMSSKKASDLGPEFMQGEDAHELERYKKILKSPDLTPEEKTIAEQRIEQITHPDFIPHTEAPPDGVSANSLVRYGMLPEGEFPEGLSQCAGLDHWWESLDQAQRNARGSSRQDTRSPRENGRQHLVRYRAG